jgi:caffeoyl-CoA O-methyltransferase
MESIVSNDIVQFACANGPTPDSIIDEMDAYADEIGFPTVGPDVGGWLALLARITDARSVFEFGSGFGYSAYWFARALPDDGEIILTEHDSEKLDRAHEYLSRGGYLDQVTLEQGDAIKTIERYDGPFDIAFLDNEKHRYCEAFESIREQVPSGGLVIADNTMTAPPHVDFDDLVAVTDGQDVEMNEGTRGIADYLETVTNDPAFETAILPLGEGVAVSHKQ